MRTTLLLLALLGVALCWLWWPREPPPAQLRPAAPSPLWVRREMTDLPPARDPRQPPERDPHH